MTQALPFPRKRNRTAFVFFPPPCVIDHAGDDGHWRATLMRAKRKAFLAVGAYVMFQGRRGHHGPQRIDNFGMFAEQQLGTDGLHRYGEHADKYAEAKQKLPGIQVGGGHVWEA